MNNPDYTARKISSPITIDGNISKAPWTSAQWSRRFGDIVTGQPGIYNTQTALLWNEDYLYIAFKAEEPFVEAKLTGGIVLFLENDLELFIDGGDCYYELEVNAVGTDMKCFLFGATHSPKAAVLIFLLFDVHHPQAYTFGGDYDRVGATFWKGTHPRGVRWAFTNFDMPGLQVATQIDGTLNDNSDIDKGGAWR